MEMSYLSEFPDYDGEFYIPKGWVDNSWHNDVCPRAMVGFQTDTMEIVFSLWQDYVDENKRECDHSKRYLFQIHLNAGLIYHYETDSIEEAKKLAEGVQI